MTFRFRTAALLALATALGACGGQRQTENATPAAGGPSAGAAAPQAPAQLAGSWALRAESGARMGPRLELAIDSVTATTFRVRVAFLMSGDVGIDPTRFEATRGAVEAEGLIRFTVKMREQAEPVGELSGAFQQDTIRLRAFRWAGEDQTAGGTRWLLVKQP